MKRPYFLIELKKLLESINTMLNLILHRAQLKINYFLLISKVKRSKIYPIGLEWKENLTQKTKIFKVFHIIIQFLTANVRFSSIQ